MKRSSLTRSTDTQQACENDSPSLSFLFSPNFCLLRIILLIFTYVTTRSRKGLNRDWRTRRVGFRFSIRFRTINIPGGIAANRDSQFLSFLRLLFSNLVAAVPARSGQVAAPLETSARGSSLKIL